MNNNTSKLKDWLLCLATVVLLAVGFEINRRFINDFVMEGIFRNKIISPLNGGYIVAMEMGLFSVIALLAFSIIYKPKWKILLSFLWKIFVLACLIGFLVGLTYTAELQSFYCGFVK